MKRKLGAVLVAVFFILLAGNGISGTCSDSVTIPLVEEHGETGIPITKHFSLVAIDLIEPKGRELQVPMMKEPDRVFATLRYGTTIRHFYIVLQDWPQNGDVIPLSQDWPQGAELQLRILNWPQKTSVTILVPQDWPQHYIIGILR